MPAPANKAAAINEVARMALGGRGELALDVLLLPPLDKEGVVAAAALEAEGTGRLLPPKIAVLVAPAAVVEMLGSTALERIEKTEDLDVDAAADVDVATAVAEATALLVGATVWASLPFRLANPTRPLPSYTEKTFLRNESPMIH